MEFSRQEYWNGLPFSPPGDLPNPGVEPESAASLALAGGPFTTEPAFEEGQQTLNPPACRTTCALTDFYWILNESCCDKEIAWSPRGWMSVLETHQASLEWGAGFQGSSSWSGDAFPYWLFAHWFYIISWQFKWFITLPNCFSLGNLICPQSIELKRPRQHPGHFSLTQNCCCCYVNALWRLWCVLGFATKCTWCSVYSGKLGIFFFFFLKFQDELFIIT